MTRIWQITVLTFTCLGAEAIVDPITAVAREFKVEQITDSQRRIDIPDAPNYEFVYIRSATFTMGGNFKEGIGEFAYNALAFGSRHPSDEGPHRRTTISRGFYLGKTKVSVQLYCRFLNEQKDPEKFIGSHPNSRYERFRRTGDQFIPKDGCENRPINTVNWDGAVAFCEWLSRKSGKKCRLPTEAEWELAAGGTDKREHPWGNDDFPPSDDFGIVDDKRIWENFDYDVGSRPRNATPDGVRDMFGPVLEWCSDWYAAKYDSRDNKDPQGPREGEFKVLRGAYNDTTRRSKSKPNGKVDGLQVSGIRLVMEP